jgi:hypothetical protein
MNYQIIQGWNNGIEKYRVYVKYKKLAEFKTKEEAINYINKLKLEKASITSDEQN